MKQERGFGRRFVLPVALFLCLWLTADILLATIIRQPFPLATMPFYRPLMNGLTRSRILSLLSGGLFIYPILFFSGARLPERLLGAFVLPLTYMVTAMIHAVAYFPAAEAVYYGFNLIATGSFFLQFATVAVADIFCRLWARRTGGGSVVTWPHLAGLLIGLLVAYVMLIHNEGTTGFYLYQKGYQLLFQ